MNNKNLLKTVLEELKNLAEPSFQEFKTTDYIVSFLKKNDIPIDKRFKTGCFGTIDIGAKKTIAFRADIDALPINKEKTLFKHLCGHHAHTAGLLLSLKEFVENKDKLKVNIRYIFQPAEEIGKGADFMIENGALENIDEIYGLHGDPNHKIGTICLKSGYLMAGACSFKLSLEGSSTHAAFPHLGNDIIVALSDYINLCQKIISRMKDPTKSALISFCLINGGYAHNILPEKIVAEGTFRFFDEQEKRLVAKKMKEILKSIEFIYGVKGRLDLDYATKPVVNSKELVMKLKKIFADTNLNILEDHDVMMGSEDFSAFLERAQGVYLKVGIAENDNHPPLHNSDFYVTDKAVKTYVEIWNRLGFNYLF